MTAKDLINAHSALYLLCAYVAELDKDESICKTIALQHRQCESFKLADCTECIKAEFIRRAQE